MLKNYLAGTLALTILLALPVSAHHGEDHQVPPVIPPVGEHHEEPHTLPVAQPPPVVQLPPVVIQPPPIPQPPAVVATPPVVIQPPQIPIQPTIPPVAAPTFSFQLPLMAPPSIILPTDITGMNSGPHAPQNGIPSSMSMTKESLAALTVPDLRYQFTGVWQSFSSQYFSKLPLDNHLKPVALMDSEQAMKYGKVEYIDKSPPQFVEASFMPTTQASYSKVNDEHLALCTGAVLVRAGDRPVFVSTQVKGEKVFARVAGGALAMISAFDDKATIVNLTDKCCGALVLYGPSTDSTKLFSLSMKPGQIAEVYAPDDKPVSNLVATRIEVNQRIGHNYGLLVSQCHYVRALKTFNLTSVLAKDELERVLKTAAAIAFVRR